MNIFCKLGLHKRGDRPDITLYYKKGNRRWQRQHFTCQRCGKKMESLSEIRDKERSTK